MERDDITTFANSRDSQETPEDKTVFAPREKSEPADQSSDATVFTPSKKRGSPAGRSADAAKASPARKAGTDQSPSSSQSADATVFTPSNKHSRSTGRRAEVAKKAPVRNTTEGQVSQPSSSSDATVFTPPKKRPRSASRSTVDSKGSPNKTAQAAKASPSGRSSKSAPVNAQTTHKVIKGRFELHDLLGVGGMGAVYKALDRRKVEASDSEPYVAIKVLNDDFRRHPDAFISLQRESRKSQTLAHPNIVTVFDFDRDADMVFMTMEFLDGSPLDRLLKEHSGVGLPVEQALSILKDISQALSYAHTHDIIHSDFKPGNIFVTKTKGAKVFDFGIARAASIGPSDEAADSFDAGELGALTPAYASLEMLNDETPDPSDDVYALACVAYELFAGVHPFEKVPANQAIAKKLKPKRIKGLSRRQWRALEKALEFSREKRTATMERFIAEFFGGARRIWLGVAATVMSGSILAASYVYNSAGQQEVDEAYKKALQQELLESRIKDKRSSIDRLLGLGTLSVDWEKDLRLEMQEYQDLVGEDNDYRAEIGEVVANKFVVAAAEYLQGGELDNADLMLRRAAKWEESNAQADIILGAVQQQRADIQARLEAERVAEERRLAEEERRLVRKKEQERIAENNRQINLAIDALEESLACSYDISISSKVAGALDQLRAVDRKRAKNIRPAIAKELSECIKKLAVANPSRTIPTLSEAITFLPEQPLLSEIRIDHCGHLKAGSGGRGNRYVCRDTLADGSQSPDLVVVAGEAGKPIAIGKHEVSVADFKAFCQSENSCGSVDLSREDLPVVGVTMPQISAYLSWLSQSTGYSYRLPTYREWFGAASANGEKELPDRNCRLKYAGIVRGAELVASKAGGENRYGLVNHVGNVQELVQDSVDGILAAGGHRADPMSRCLVSTTRKHSGDGDALTGFRIVRNIRSY